jgi:hypothetical protein
LNAQEQKSPPTREDLKQFGELPVRFNGRVTTYEVVAKNYLRYCSDGEVCYDQEGQEHPAVRWLLEVMADRENRDDWRIFRIENARLLERLELKPGKGGEVPLNHFSLNELRPKARWIQDQSEELSRSFAPLKADDQAILDLSNRLTHCVMLELNVSPLPALTRDNSQAVIDRIVFLETQALPMFVFSAKVEEWMTLPLAHLEEAVAGDNAENRNPLYQQLRDLLNAYQEQNLEAFRTGLDRYAKSLQMSEARNSPFRMSPAKDWVEIGVAPLKELHFYSDAYAHGHKIVDMSLAGTPSSQFFVNHFPTEHVSPLELQNTWRMELGLVPLAEADAKQGWKPIEVAGRKAILMDDETPDEIEIPRPRRFITVVLKEDGHTFVFAWNGPKEILAANMEKFHSLMRSIELNSATELADWFPGQAQPEPPDLKRLLAAVVPDGQHLWLFVTSGSDQAVKSHREKFLTFLKSVELEKTDAQPAQLRWQLPEEWKQIGGYAEATFVLGQGENALPMTITPLGDVREKSVFTLIDYWAKKLGMSPLADKDRKAAITEITVAERQAFLVELHKPEEAPLAEISYQVPQGFKELPPSPILHGSFEITQGQASATLTITALPANKNLAANIDRWRAQLDLPMQSGEEVLKTVKDLTVSHQPGKLVELHNPETKQRILAAIVNWGGKDWYFKMMGDADLVEQQGKAFEGFLKTVTFSEMSRTKTTPP